MMELYSSGSHSNWNELLEGFAWPVGGLEFSVSWRTSQFGHVADVWLRTWLDSVSTWLVVPVIVVAEKCLSDATHQCTYSGFCNLQEHNRERLSHPSKAVVG